MSIKSKFEPVFTEECNAIPHPYRPGFVLARCPKDVLEKEAKEKGVSVGELVGLIWEPYIHFDSFLNGLDQEDECDKNNE